VSPNPFVFVVGCPRSGTTLLQRMLDHHPLLAVANDSHFIPRALERSAQHEGNPPLTPDLVESVRTYRRFHRLGLPDSAVARAAARSDTYASFVSSLYSAFARVHGKALGGEKTPDYVKHLPLLGRLFPGARTIHLIRDGRDVAVSTLAWAREDKGPGRFRLWRTRPVAVCALWWSWLVSTGTRDGRRLGADRYQEVRYEDLTATPQETVGELLRFLGLPDSRDCVTFHEGKVRNDPNLSPKQAWLPATPGLRNWRRELDQQDVELFEAIAGNLLSSLGYERAFPTISDAAQEVADDSRRRWDLERAERAARRARRQEVLERA
jgi:Sulfotransferase family